MKMLCKYSYREMAKILQEKWCTFLYNKNWNHEVRWDKDWMLFEVINHKSREKWNMTLLSLRILCKRLGLNYKDYL